MSIECGNSVVESDHSATGRAWLALRIVLAFGTTMAWGCGSNAPALHARMSDEEIHSTLESRIAPGATQAQVEAGLDGLGVDAKRRIHYKPTDSRPQVLLARLFEPGGAWLHGEDDDIVFVDVSFVFEPPDRLSKTLLFRDRIRYFQHEPITGSTSPKRALMKPLGRYPLPIPPPIDPLERAH